MLTPLLIIFGLIILYWAVTVTLNMPGCTGNCHQGKYECDCPLKKEKNDIQ
jgi:hypothetical protein